MTRKNDVDLSRYRKAPRYLPDPLLKALLPGGGLEAIADTVRNSSDLRLDIRERRFNVYYGGGSMLCVDARTNPWSMKFDPEYFAKVQMPSLPKSYRARADAEAWVRAFADLRIGMSAWWGEHPRGERNDCQAMAMTNSARAGMPPGDFVVLDLEYQWAQRRFDLVALERTPTTDDVLGWDKPNLVFIEVKSALNACMGAAGINVHEADYRSLLAAPPVQVERIHQEFKDVCSQKRALRLLDPQIACQGLAAALPKLLFAFVGMVANRNQIAAILQSDCVGNEKIEQQIGFIELDHNRTVMRTSDVLDRRSFLKRCTGAQCN